MSENTIRCPECHSAILNRLEIQVQKAKRSREGIDAKICRHCNIIIPVNNQMKFWNGKEVISVV